MLSALSLDNLTLQQKFMTVHGSSGVGSYGHHLTALGSTGEEGPAPGKPEGSALAAPSCSPISGEVTGTLAVKCGQKEMGLSKISVQRWLLNLHLQRKGARQRSAPHASTNQRGMGFSKGTDNSQGTSKTRSWGQEMRAQLTVVKMTKSHGNEERALGFGQKDGWRA